MKAVIIGCGGVASRWIRVLNDDPRIEIVALIDPDRQAAIRLAERYGLTVACTATLDEALRVHEFEVAVNLTPPEAHAVISCAGLSAGLHVLSEKPLATSLGDAMRLVELARRSGRVLAVMQNRGQDPQFLAFRDLVHRGTRSPLAVTADVFVDLSNPGFRASQRLPAICDLAVHAFDQIRGLITAPATGMRCSEFSLGVLGQHCALAVIAAEFADGSVFSYRGGYTAGPGLRTGANGLWGVEAGDFAARWDGGTIVSISSSATESWQEIVLPAGLPGYQVCITTMIDALHGVEHAMCQASSNLDSIALLDAALASAVTATSTAVQPVPGPGDVRP